MDARYEFDEIPIDLAGKPCGMFHGEYTLDEGRVDRIWVYSDTGWGASAKRELVALHDLSHPFARDLYTMLRDNILGHNRDYPPRRVTNHGGLTCTP